MKVLGASVLIAESMTMGVAILLAMKDHSSAAIIYGCVISFLLFLAAALVRRPGGFVIGPQRWPPAIDQSKPPQL